MLFMDKPAHLWFSNSHWISDFLTNLQSNPSWIQPNIFSMLRNNFGIFGVIFWFILYTITLVLNFQLWSKYKPSKAVLWSLALTTIVSPYIWSWDFVLLLPLFVNTTIRLSSRHARLILFSFYITCYVLSIVALQPVGAGDAVLWWIPFKLLIGITLSIKINQKICPKDKSVSAIVAWTDV